MPLLCCSSATVAFAAGVGGWLYGSVSVSQERKAHARCRTHQQEETTSAVEAEINVHTNKATELL